MTDHQSGHFLGAGQRLGEGLVFEEPPGCHGARRASELASPRGPRGRAERRYPTLPSTLLWLLLVGGGSSM